MLSLTASLNGCKVVTGSANKVQSDRFQNPDLMLCSFWGGYNSKGQKVCPDSFMTKSAGCNSAEDRVVVENNLRPSYAAHIGLNTAGIELNYGDMTTMYAGWADDEIQHALETEPSFGSGFQELQPGCGTGVKGVGTPYKGAMAYDAQQRRYKHAVSEGFQRQQYRNASGF